MSEKDMQLMNAGMKLFAERGYHNTSVQEIAKGAGMSKGSFYLYFQSKEDFLTRAIQFYYREIASRLEEIKKQDDLNAKESFAAQIAVLGDYVSSYKDFIMMHLRENIPTGHHTDQLVNQMKTENFHWLEDNLQAIYGNEIGIYMIDAIIQSEGLINGYFKWMVVDGLEIEQNLVGSYLVERIDNLVTGMLAQQTPPLISREDLPLAYTAAGGPLGRKHLPALVDHVKATISELISKPERQAELLEVADIIAQEVKKKAPRMMMIQGMLVHFQSQSELKPFAVQIAEALDIELLE